MAVQVTQCAIRRWLAPFVRQDGFKYVKARGAKLNGEVQGVPPGVVGCKWLYAGSRAQESFDALEVVAYNRQVQGRVGVSAARKSGQASPCPQSPLPTTLITHHRSD